jgi:hypothetical protein
VINQTQHRILQGERVPADENLFNVFEPHTDIIIKGARDIHYGHKLNLSSGKSGLLEDDIGGEFHLHEAPVVIGAEAPLERAELFGPSIDSVVNLFGIQAIGKDSLDTFFLAKRHMAADELDLKVGLDGKLPGVLTQLIAQRLGPAGKVEQFYVVKSSRLLKITDIEVVSTWR